MNSYGINVLAWFIAMAASFVLAYFWFTMFTGDAFAALGYVSIGLGLLCAVATIGALMDDLGGGQ